MRKGLKNWSIEIIIGVVALIIGDFILREFAGIKVFSFIWSIFLPFLRCELPIWLFVVLFILGVIVYFVRSRLNGKMNVKRPIYSNYNRDSFWGVSYRWDYLKDNTNKYYIGEIVAYCPICGRRIACDQCPIGHVYVFERKNRDEIESMIRYEIEKRFGVDEFVEVGRHNDE